MQSIKFTYQGTDLYASKHAWQKMEERIGPDPELINGKIKAILNLGRESEFNVQGRKNKERIIQYQEYQLHIRENTIVTIKYNRPYFGTTMKNSRRSLNKLSKKVNKKHYRKDYNFFDD